LKKSKQYTLYQGNGLLLVCIVAPANWHQILHLTQTPLDANLSRDKEWIAYSSLTPYATLSSTDVYRDVTIPLDFNESRLGIQRVRLYSTWAPKRYFSPKHSIHIIVVVTSIFWFRQRASSWSFSSMWRRPIYFAIWHRATKSNRLSWRSLGRCECCVLCGRRFQYLDFRIRRHVYQSMG
jgi:hypothetical protein